MTRSVRGRARAFTLVEMLVVLGIIAVLAALLLPATMSVVNKARVGAMAMEINQLAAGLESYKQDKGDYPPGFRDPNVLIAHLRKCYPKMSQTELQFFFNYDSTGAMTGWKTGKQLDEGEALVFWLSLTSTDPRLPFTGASKKVYYEFKADRLFDGVDADPVDADGFIDNTTRDDPNNLMSQSRYKSYLPAYAGESAYILIDHRAYAGHLRASMGVPPAAVAEDGESGATRPYLDAKDVAMKNTTFQILCAGQDGLFDDGGTTPGGADPDFKRYPGGDFYTEADKDNITNFSEGGRLIDRVP